MTDRNKGGALADNQWFAEAHRARLRAWLHDNSNGDSRRRLFAERLLEMPDAGWSAVRGPNLPSTVLLSWVEAADYAARHEVLYRQPAEAEASNLREVRAKAGELLAALKDSRILDRSSELRDDGTVVSWTRNRAECQDRCGWELPHIVLPDLLDALREKCKTLVDSPPPRATERVSGGDRATYQRAFIRTLHAHVTHRCGDDATAREINATTKHASCSVLGIQKLPAELRVILRDSPYRT